jgi:hypothetical protein
MQNDSSNYLKVDGMIVSYDELYDAFERLCRLQAHYAQLLNMQDGGERLSLGTPELAIQRLRKVEEEKKSL